jgi:hypothetical protein
VCVCVCVCVCECVSLHEIFVDEIIYNTLNIDIPRLTYSLAASMISKDGGVKSAEILRSQL